MLQHRLLDVLAPEVSQETFNIIVIVAIAVIFILLCATIGTSGNDDQKLMGIFGMCTIGSILLTFMLFFNFYIILGFIVTAIALVALESNWWRIEEKVKEWRNNMKVSIN
jgi:O-antigen ligase